MEVDDESDASPNSFHSLDSDSNDENPISHQSEMILSNSIIDLNLQ